MTGPLFVCEIALQQRSGSRRVLLPPVAVWRTPSDLPHTDHMGQNDTRDECPFCGSSDVVQGSLRTVEGDPVHFRPEGTRSFAWTLKSPSEKLVEQGRATACTGCGAVWARLNARELVGRLEIWGKQDQ